jgi:hypothetical protein
MGNERANELAQMATTDTQLIPPPAETVPISVIEGRQQITHLSKRSSIELRLGSSYRKSIKHCQENT